MGGYGSKSASNDLDAFYPALSLRSLNDLLFKKKK